MLGNYTITAIQVTMTMTALAGHKVENAFHIQRLGRLRMNDFH